MKIVPISLASYINVASAKEIHGLGTKDLLKKLRIPVSDININQTSTLTIPLAFS